MTNLNKDFFINNRKNLLNKSGAKLIAIAANGLMQSTSSVTLDFQQDSNFFYLTGVNEPNMILVITANEEFLIAGIQTEVGIVFDGDIDGKKIGKTSGLKQMLSNEEGWKKLELLVKKYKTVHSIKPPDAFIPIYSMYTNPARADMVKKLKKHGAKIKDIFPSIAELRVIKQVPELKALQQAIDVTGEAFKVIQKNIATYQFEYEVVADVASTFYKLTQNRPAYESIVSSGKNACTIHYVDASGSIDRSKPLLMDIGAQVDHYIADITRTMLPKNTRSEEVYQAIADLHTQALSMVKPGVKFIDYERAMENYYFEKLKLLGILTDSQEKLVRKFVPHATSHYLGLDAHDAGDYHQEFKAGMVITVEPGFYIPNEEIGIRIEDDILITETGVEVLSKAIPQKMQLI